MNEIDENIAYLIECATGEKWIPESEAKEREEAAAKGTVECSAPAGDVNTDCWDAAAAKAWDGAKSRAKDIVKDTGRDLASIAVGAAVASKVAKSDKSKLQKTRDIAKMVLRRK